MTRLQELRQQGQSMWLDYIRRSLLTGGELKRLVEQGLGGVTSNPTIFQKAIADSNDYDESLRELLSQDGQAETSSLFEALAVEDIRMAADILKPVYDESEGADGFVSLEVSPHLANDTEGTVAEARRLWSRVSRPNVMIKVPATEAGIPAIETLIGEGINVNVTLMFSLSHYEAVAEAYMRGLKTCEDPENVSSVASFFVSRVDGAVDSLLEKNGSRSALALQSKVAIANAKLAYRRFQEIFLGDSFASLKKRGARVQRPLWASTSTKNPDLSDVLYVDQLIGPHTVNTVPPNTLEAFLDHGTVEPTIARDQEEAKRIIERLEELGIDLERVTSELQLKGVRSFAQSYDDLMDALEQKRSALTEGCRETQQLKLGRYEQAVQKRIGDWKESQFGCRLWRKDWTLWSDQPVEELSDRLGWLELPEAMQSETERLAAFAEEVKNDGIEQVVVLGMGGSSLAPEVFQKSIGNRSGFPRLTVLDSTHPDAVRSVERQIDLDRTLFLVSSKSGTTTETLSFFRYFWHKMKERTENPGNHFVAITDPGTSLQELARERNFRRLFKAPPDVGGRYSALTVFGLVPAALIGVDLDRLLDRAHSLAEAAAFCVDVECNPALELGAALGELTRAGRDKLTFLASPSLAPLSAWLEQLIAESTGKEGTGIVPVADEPAGSPQDYGNDRFFVALELEGEENEARRESLQKLEGAGHPVAYFHLREKAQLGSEFFRWELAVAAAGAALGIHPFNQPNVELAKTLARRSMNEAESASGSGDGGVQSVASSDSEALLQEMKRWLQSAAPPAYLSIQAFLAPGNETGRAMEEIRSAFRNRFKIATTAGYGPRFLHSTGQLHKGGPDTGLFLQLVDQPRQDLQVPESDFTFARLIRAQAMGDYQALMEQGRKVLRVQLGNDPSRGLQQITQLLSRL